MKYLEKLFGDKGIFTKDRSISGQVLVICAALVLILVFSISRL